MDNKKLAYLYNLNHAEVNAHEKYLKYSMDEYCCYYEPKPYVDIGPNQYTKPIEFMLEYFLNVNKFKFLSKMLDEAKQIENKTNIKYSNSYSNYVSRDEVILQYISNRPKTFIMTIWPCASKSINDIIKYLEQNGIVSVCREIELSYNGAQNLICHLYNKIIISKTSIERKLKFINSKLEYSKFIKNKNNKFYVIVFENINDLPISGTGAIFKTQLREYIKTLILNKSPGENIELPDTVHINDFFYEAIEYAQTYFHEQTLINLNNKILKNWLDPAFLPSFLRLNALKSWKIQNLSNIESQRLILLTGSSFYTTGIRKSADIDSIFINVGSDSDREQELENLIFQDFFNIDTKIPFIDSGMPETSAWKDSWTEANNDFYRTFPKPIDDFCIAFDPSMYYYWNGLKIMTLDLTLKFKLHRYIPSDYVDFIILSELYSQVTNIKLIISSDNIWRNKSHRSKEKINQLIIKSFDRYLINDKNKIKIKKYLIE